MTEMVMANRQSLITRNGRRYQANSPDSSDFSDKFDEEEKGIRVGDEYQAEIPPCNPDQKFASDDAMLVWAPTTELSDAKVSEYIDIARRKHGYNMEQALGMLFWHKHNVDRALSDLANFTPFPDEWTVEDKVLFEQAYNFHGKKFHRIHQMLPDKPIPSLVKHFYTWKKKRETTSVMDKNVRKRVVRANDEDIEAGSNNSGEDIVMKEEEPDTCSNCGLKTPNLHVTNMGVQCSLCYQSWRRTGVLRPTSKRQSGQVRHNPIKHKHKPPKGMYLDGKDLFDMVMGSSSQTDAAVKGLDLEIVALKKQVQKNKQELSLQLQKLGNGVVDFKPEEQRQTMINSRWTDEELLLAVQGVRKYGKDFKAIAEMLGNKMETHIRSFFMNFRRRYNLDEVLAEYEAEQRSQVIPDDVEMTSVPAGAAPPNNAANDNQDGPAKEVGHWNDKGPQVNGGSSALGVASHTVPPPLHKQSAPPHPSAPSTAAAPNRLPPTHKTILQQPPPLIRPAPGATGQPGSKTALPSANKDGVEKQ